MTESLNEEQPGRLEPIDLTPILWRYVYGPTILSILCCVGITALIYYVMTRDKPSVTGGGVNGQIINREMFINKNLLIVLLVIIVLMNLNQKKYLKITNK